MLKLHPHPSEPTGPVKSIEVALGRTNEGYRLWYFLIGDIGRIVVPDQSERASRTDDLWKTTCFEAFVKGDKGDAYCEFNFSPSGDWASYAFDRYREGRRDMPTAVTINTERLANLLCVEARFNADFAKSTRLCLAAVVEEVGGAITHWSLAHSADKPDFHDDSCFAVRLADIA